MTTTVKRRTINPPTPLPFPPSMSKVEMIYSIILFNFLKSLRRTEPKPISQRLLVAFSGPPLENMLEHLDASSQSALFRTYKHHFAKLNPKETLILFKKCFTLTFARRILKHKPQLHRSIEISNFSIENRAGKFNTLPESDALLKIIQRSGSKFAFSHPISQSLTIKSLSELKEYIDSLPDSWKGMITGLNLKGFDLRRYDTLTNLEHIIAICKKLMLVQLYKDDMPGETFTNKIEKLNCSLSDVKLRISI